MSLDDATRRQIEAAHPGQSTWLSANAGSGKTRVLTDRVARLLLDDVPPDHILCLTYTKAAATEMQNRLFRRLGDWAMQDDAALSRALTDLGVKVPDAGFLARARTLFAHAIETPGGLRIQTIHSFCAALLRRFPLEARVSPQFTEIEDRAAEVLRADVLEQMALGPEADLLAAVSMRDTDQTLDKLAGQVCTLRDVLTVPTTYDRIAAGYGLSAGLTEADVIARIFAGDTIEFLAQCSAVLVAQSSKTDHACGQNLARVKAADAAGLAAIETAVLTQKGELRKNLVTKPVRTGVFAPYFDRFEDLAQQVHAARETRLALQAAVQDWDLYRFAQAFLPRYEAEKERRGWLDFDDLIARAQALLNDPQVAAWVLYRLDGGIDHILVDEAQDTSPRQWSVIESLAQEFTAGQGARSDVARTLFVVGDKKQSIYSFQGADAAEFDRMRDAFRGRLQAVGDKLHERALAYSFRSARPILSTVDATFDGRVASGFAQEEPHRAFWADLPGRVDLWPRVPTTPSEEDGPWYQPVDYISPRHHTVVLAKRVAETIRHLIDSGHPLPQGGGARPVRAGDFLILVRTRGTLFTEIIRACKQAQLPIAGADRLKVMAELAVRDIAALLAFVDTPEDDLSLAVALKSPLFGLTEQDLFTLSHGRGKRYLWQVLRERADSYPKVLQVITDLREQADFLRPYDLIERLLTRHNGRQRLLGRLGDEAQDGIDALLAQALSYERTEVPSLTGFLHWMQSDDLEIKRQMDSASNRIRVMTVHGAKGLEAPIVILPDTAARRIDIKDKLLRDGDLVVWKQSSSQVPPRQQAVIDDRRAAQERENDRLLYVAMTRAENWLMVGAHDNAGGAQADWYAQIEAGMLASDAQPQAFGFGDGVVGQGLRLDSGGWDSLKPEHIAPPQTAPVTIPSWADQRIAPPVPAPQSRSPSDLGGAKALPGADGDETETAKQRGTAVHLLLEHLPRLPNPTPDLAQRLLAHHMPELPEVERAALVQEAFGVVQAPGLDWVFAPGTLCEVPVAAHVPGLGPMAGVIDRLWIGPDLVVAVDFKTNRAVPSDAAACPEGILRQMGAYAAMLGQIYPGKRVETGFLWTWTATYMGLPQDIVTQALMRAHLDGGAAAS